MVAEVKTKREILEEKTYRERRFEDFRIDEMQKDYDEAMRMGRWDKKRECYTEYKGNPVIDSITRRKKPINIFSQSWIR
ncbi:hypothetical protein Hanom_Chr05g00399821 [Helianthus anomalus]